MPLPFGPFREIYMGYYERISRLRNEHSGNATTGPLKFLVVHSYLKGEDIYE